MEDFENNCSMKYKWGEWPVENCAMQEYFGIEFHRTDICDFLKTYDNVTLHVYYIITVLELVFAVLAIITNSLFFYITILVLKDKNNSSRNLFTFLFSRSLSIIILQLIGLVLRFEMDTRLSILLFVFSSFFCILVWTQTYIVLSLLFYTSIVHSKWFTEKVVMKTCIILNAFIWISSITLTVIIGGISYTTIFSETEENCNFENCEKPFAVFTGVIFIVIYVFALQMTAIFIFTLFKLLKTRMKNNIVRIQSNQNRVAMKRLFYNILIFAFTRSPFVLFCIFMLVTIDHMEDMDSCIEIYHEAINFEVFLHIATVMAMFGMITDPIITVWSNFSMIREFFKKSNSN